ncbi:hypothetical protein ZEAMMB73_Zm00001d002977 [Zea mays]|uniref:Uncharacterized protein n=1 Tax=Zea mays TaxID=4577 RepID=A0A1D6E5U0_MAIZE|nr:hypothetical protein ZEAMMB73_Zm00001d002977 [Zea mays]
MASTKRLRLRTGGTYSVNRAAEKATAISSCSILDERTPPGSSSPFPFAPAMRANPIRSRRLGIGRMEAAVRWEGQTP